MELRHRLERRKENQMIGDMTFEEYAALWGCDPCYDREPRLRGDGYLFYNFSVERDDPQFLREFLPAISRTIQCVEREGGSDEDIADLEDLAAYVRDLLTDI